MQRCRSDQASEQRSTDWTRRAIVNPDRDPIQTIPTNPHRTKKPNMPSHRRLRASPLIPAIQQSHCPVLILVGARIKRLEKECDRDPSLAQSRAIPNHQCRHNSDKPISALQRSAMSIESDDVRLRTPAECHVRNWVRYPIPIELAVPRLLHRSRTTDLCRINLPVAIQQL